MKAKNGDGNQPTVSIYATQDQEAEELIKRIQEQIAAGIDPREICVVARTNALIDDYKKYLTAAGIDHFEIKRRQMTAAAWESGWLQCIV